MKLKIQKVEGIFRSIVLSKFIKQLFLLIKPGLSESFLYVLFFLIKKKLNYSPIFLFFEIIDKIRPKIGLKFFRRYKFNELETFVVPYLLTTYFQYNRAIF
jgi:ribosomal protein S7